MIFKFNGNYCLCPDDKCHDKKSFRFQAFLPAGRLGFFLFLLEKKTRLVRHNSTILNNYSYISDMKGIADLLGRIFIGIIFFYEVLDTLFFYETTKDTMTSYGLTWGQDTFLIAALILMSIGALLVFIGYFARVGAVFLLLYWIPYTFIVFSFWNDPPDLQRMNALHFMRNLAVAGGLLLLLANGSGKYSVRRLIHVMRLPQ